MHRLGVRVTAGLNQRQGKQQVARVIAGDSRATRVLIGHQNTRQPPALVEVRLKQVVLGVTQIAGTGSIVGELRRGACSVLEWLCLVALAVELAY